ncbi:hypothetical protein ACQP2X_26155 [Actinoplanes sp. CA-131856]
MARSKKSRTARRRPQAAPPPPGRRLGPAARKTGAFVLAAVLAGVTAWITGLTGKGIDAVAGIFRDDAPLTVTGRRPDVGPSPSSNRQPSSTTRPGSTTQSSPDEPSSSGPRSSPAGTTAAARWEGDLQGFRSCGSRKTDGLVVNLGPDAIEPPDDEGDPYEAAQRWIDEYDAADRGVTAYDFVVQARPGRTATLLGIRAEYVSRSDPAAVATVVFLHYEECGGTLEPRRFTVDLDDPSGRMVPARGEKTDFPYTVGNDEPEAFSLVATSSGCDCVWRIALDWSADGETGTSYLVDDESGQAFHTAPERDLPRLAWTYFAERRWTRTRA